MVKVIKKKFRLRFNHSKILIKNLSKQVAGVVVQNKLVSLIVILYIIITFLQLSWGLPNADHPFDYNMDEWAQARSLRTTFTHGTPHIFGGGNGTFLFYVLSGIFLVPFILLGIVNPFAIQSSMLNFDEQLRLFEVLRTSSVLYGALSIVLVCYIAKRFFNVSAILTACFFVFTPIYLLLTNFYRYDTPVIFFILLSLVYAFKYKEKPTSRNFILLGIISATAIGIKVSAIPLFITYIISFFLFTKNWREKFKLLITGSTIFIIVALVVSIPDALISIKPFLNWFLYSSVGSGGGTDNFNLGIHYLLFLVFSAYPATFGWGFYIIGVMSFMGLLFLNVRAFFSSKLLVINKNEIFLLVSTIVFMVSIIPLKIGAHGNRMLIFAPFLALISAIGISKFKKLLRNKYSLLIPPLVTFVVVFQLVECTTWLPVKFIPDPRDTSSQWIVKNISENTIIGLENVPIFQSMPNILVREFYTLEYFPKQKTLYRYFIYDSDTSKFPSYVVMSNHRFTKKYVKHSEKNNLVDLLFRQGYREIASFSPNYRYLYYFHSEIAVKFASLIPIPHEIVIWKK